MAQKILELQKASYPIEGELIGFADLPPLKDTVESLQHCGEAFYGYFAEGGRLAGILSYKQTGNVLDIHRVAVHPDFFRRGIARSLLGFLEDEAKKQCIMKIIVSTGKANTPAVRLYTQTGYTPIGELEVGPGIKITQFEKLFPLNL